MEIITEKTDEDGEEAWEKDEKGKNLTRHKQNLSSDRLTRRLRIPGPPRMQSRTARRRRSAATQTFCQRSLLLLGATSIDEATSKGPF